MQIAAKIIALYALLVSATGCFFESFQPNAATLYVPLSDSASMEIHQDGLNLSLNTRRDVVTVTARCC